MEPVVIQHDLSGLRQDEDLSIQLVGFCDASQSAYAAIMYLRVMGLATSVLILASKTRVAPLKTVTIPRLELLSALLLARLINSIDQALKKGIHLEPPLCFTDSKITLGWVHGAGKEWKQFVENRVSEIRRLVPPKCWHHCPGVDNPANIPSRGLNPADFRREMSFWLEGPVWLRRQLCLEDERDQVVPEKCLEELRKADKKVLVLCTATTTHQATVVDVERFSTLKRLLRVIAQVFRFIRLSRRRPETGEIDKRLTACDMESAHELLIQMVQSSLAENQKF